MTVRVLFFASLKESVGVATLALELQQPLSISGLLERLRTDLGERAYAAITAESVRIAINQELATAAAAIQPGDEVAFLPPVTGG